MIHDAAVDLDVMARQPFLGILDEIEAGVQRKLDMDPAHADLLEKKELVVVGPRVHHGSDFGVIGVVFIDFGSGGARDAYRGGERSREAGSQRV